MDYDNSKKRKKVFKLLIKEIEPEAQSYKLERNYFYNSTYGTRDTIVKSRDTLDLIIDPPCLEACKYLYDCNILTINSTANKKNIENGKGAIDINYHSLDDYNRKVVDSLVSEGLIHLREDFDKESRDEVFSIEIPINENTTVEDFSNQMLTIAKYFQPQEIRYGYYTKDEFYDYVAQKAPNALVYNATEEKWKNFAEDIIDKLDNGEISADSPANIEIFYGERKAFISFDTLCLEYAKTINYFYDENEEKYWVDKELYEKAMKENKKYNQSKIEKKLVKDEKNAEN